MALWFPMAMQRRCRCPLWRSERPRASNRQKSTAAGRSGWFSAGPLIEADAAAADIRRSLCGLLQWTCALGTAQDQTELVTASTSMNSGAPVTQPRPPAGSRSEHGQSVQIMEMRGAHRQMSPLRPPSISNPRLPLTAHLITLTKSFSTSPKGSTRNSNGKAGRHVIMATWTSWASPTGTMFICLMTVKLLPRSTSEDMSALPSGSSSTGLFPSIHLL